MAVVTFSRQLGSDGTEVAVEVAAQLGATYLDREILTAASQLVEMPEGALGDLDERSPGWAERLISTIALAFSPGESRWDRETKSVAASPPRQVSDVRLLFATRTVIRRLAERGGAVIVGRGAQVLLREQPDAMHVRVITPMQTRVARVAERKGVSKEAAVALIEESDEHQRSYLRRFYSVDWDDPTLYHLVLNSGRLSRGEAVQLLVHLAHSTDKKQVDRALSLIAPHSDRGGVQLAQRSLQEALTTRVGSGEWASAIRTAHSRLKAEMGLDLSVAIGAGDRRDVRDIGQAIGALARLGAR